MNEGGTVFDGNVRIKEFPEEGLNISIGRGSKKDFIINLAKAIFEVAPFTQIDSPYTEAIKCFNYAEEFYNAGKKKGYLD